MQPTRAAWCFAFGIGWLVLRGVLVRSQAWLSSEYAAREGGVFLLIPLLSLLAGLTVPVFFYSFLKHHRFVGQPWLRSTTLASLAVTVVSLGLMVDSFVATARGVEPSRSWMAMNMPWVFQAVSAAFVLVLIAFLVAFSVEFRGPTRLRRSAAIGAVGAVVPLFLVTAWIIHSRFPGSLQWFPSFSQGAAATVFGLAGAGTLIWFLESFAAGYGDDDVV